MRIYFKANPPKYPGTLACTEYGPILDDGEHLKIHYRDYVCVYSHKTKTWYREIDGVIYENVFVVPVFDFEEILVFNNVLFDFLCKDECTEFTEEERSEYIKDFYRARRAKNCFPIVNRGQVWYNHLSIEQKVDLNDWYENWLDVTETLLEPASLSWLNEKINKIEPEEIL